MEEHHVQPSHWAGLNAYAAWGGLMLLLLLAVWQIPDQNNQPLWAGLLLLPWIGWLITYARLRTTSYHLDDEGLQWTRGLWSRSTDHLAWTRVVDLALCQPLWYRSQDLWDLTLHNQDATHPVLHLRGVPQTFAEAVQAQVQSARKQVRHVALLDGGES